MAAAARPERELVVMQCSQFSCKALAALHVKGFTRPNVDYRVSAAPIGYNGRKALLPAPFTVPVLRWDGEVVCGSDNICAFLDERFPDGPLLYPPACAAEVRRIEAEVAGWYYLNGWLSVVDPEGFDRWSGEVARRWVDGGGAGWFTQCSALVLPRSVTDPWVQEKGSKDWCKSARARGAELGGAVGEMCGRLVATPPADATTVIEEARGVLRGHDAQLRGSATAFFCGADHPTAADLTLYGMLERWLGDGLTAGEFGAAQPQIADGMPDVLASWGAMRALFRPALDLPGVGGQPLEEPTSPATWPRAAGAS